MVEFQMSKGSSKFENRHYTYTPVYDIVKISV